MCMYMRMLYMDCAHVCGPSLCAQLHSYVSVRTHAGELRMGESVLEGLNAWT